MIKKLLFSVVLAALAAVFASQNPDGLDKVSEMLGFAGKGTEHSAIMSGYNIGFLGTSKLSTILAGIAGVLISACIFFFGVWLVKACGFGKKTTIDDSHSI